MVETNKMCSSVKSLVDSPQPPTAITRKVLRGLKYDPNRHHTLACCITSKYGNKTDISIIKLSPGDYFKSKSFQCLSEPPDLRVQNT